MMKQALHGKLDPSATEHILAAAKDTTAYNQMGAVIDTAYQYSRTVETASPQDAITFLAYAAQSELIAHDDQKKSAHEKTLRVVGSILKTQLFQENSLGITTVGQAEKDIITDLSAELIKQAKSAGLSVIENKVIDWPQNESAHRSNDISIPDTEIVRRIERKQALFWEDARRAGQIVYHNTGNLDDISRTGAIMPRTEQVRQNGTMNAQMDPTREAMHSIVPHFSEHFDSKTYKIKHPGKLDQAVGTVATPLIEVIKVAPYARDAKYGIVEPKSATTLEHVHVNNDTRPIGVGNDDFVNIGGVDRVFFASPSEKGVVKPDQYAIPLTRDSTLVFVGHDEIMHSPQYGLGESYPGRLHIADEEQEASVIANFQADQIRKYGNKLIVPLRRGVFDYQPENMDSRDGLYRPSASYSQNPTLDTLAA